MTFGPTAEVPDPRAGYNGWMSNQTGVTETLMGIDYDLNLYPRLASGIEQTSPPHGVLHYARGWPFTMAHP